MNELLLDKSKRGGKHKAFKDKRSHKLAEERELRNELYERFGSKF